MNIGFLIVEQERQEAVERAMRRYRAQQAIEKRRTGLGHGARRISREEATALVAKKNRLGALRLIHGMLGGRVVR